LNGELERLRTEIDRLQSAHDTAVSDNRALKLQLDERHLINTNSSLSTAVCRYIFLLKWMAYLIRARNNHNSAFVCHFALIYILLFF